MTLVVRLVIAVACALAAASCDRTHDIQFAPVVAGQTEVKGDDGRWHEVPLTPEQASLLSRWLESHREGWQGLMETPPLPAFTFSVETIDRRRYRFQVFVRPQGDGVAFVLGGAKVPLKHRLSADDARTLRAAMGSAALLRHTAAAIPRFFAAWPGWPAS